MARSRGAVEGRGDDARDWLARTYHALKHDLLTIAVHLTGERSTAEDVVHDVFVALARRPASAPHPTSIGETRRYLVTSCVHRARDLARRRSLPLEDRERLGHALEPRGDPLVHVTAADETARVRASLLDLPVDQRAVVTLHLHGGLKFREIAELLGIPLDTATSRYRYALEKLERALIARGVKA